MHLRQAGEKHGVLPVLEALVEIPGKSRSFRLDLDTSTTSESSHKRFATSTIKASCPWVRSKAPPIRELPPSKVESSIVTVES